MGRIVEFRGKSAGGRSGRRTPPHAERTGRSRRSGRRIGLALGLALTAGALAGGSLLAPALEAKAGEIAGRALVTDGDTIEVDGRRIRLRGIDAPETAQSCQEASGRPYPCGREAREALALFLRGHDVACRPLYRDRYGRDVADCVRDDGIDVAGHMVRSGHALDWPKYSDGAFAAAEAEARAARRGLWRGRFTRPWEYRRKGK